MGHPQVLGRSVGEPVNPIFIGSTRRSNLHLQMMGQRIVDVHHGNYNPSCKAKSNMQEDSDGPMIRARTKQLQKALTSQIGMIEATSELKISNQFEIGSRMFICLQLELGDGKSP